MTRRDAERRESSAAGKQLPNASDAPFPFRLSVRVGVSLPEQTEDVMKLNAGVAARANLCLLRNRSLSVRRGMRFYSVWAHSAGTLLHSDASSNYFSEATAAIGNIKYFSSNSLQMARKGQISRLPIVSGRLSVFGCWCQTKLIRRSDRIKNKKNKTN